MPETLRSLQAKLQEYLATMVEPRNQPTDSAGLPIYHDGVWGPWVTLDENDFTGQGEVPPVHCSTKLSDINESATTPMSNTTRGTGITMTDRTEMPFNTPVPDHTDKSNSQDNSYRNDVFSVSRANQQMSYFDWWLFLVFWTSIIIRP